MTVVPKIIFMTIARIVSWGQKFTGAMCPTHSSIPQHCGSIDGSRLQTRIDHWKKIDNSFN